MKYSEKLKDPRWQKKRLEVLTRDEWQCVWCGDNESTLHVHHLAYAGDPWDIPIGMLITLCESCHQEDHEHRKEAEDALIQAIREAGFSYSDVTELAIGFHQMKPFHAHDVMAGVIEWMLKTPEMTSKITELYFNHLRKKGCKWPESLNQVSPITE